MFSLHVTKQTPISPNGNLATTNSLHYIRLQTIPNQQKNTKILQTGRDAKHFKLPKGNNWGVTKHVQGRVKGPVLTLGLGYAYPGTCAPASFRGYKTRNSPTSPQTASFLPRCKQNWKSQRQKQRKTKVTQHHCRGR